MAQQPIKTSGGTVRITDSSVLAVGVLPFGTWRATWVTTEVPPPTPPMKPAVPAPQLSSLEKKVAPRRICVS